MFTLTLSFTKVQNGWIVENEADLERTYVAKSLNGWDGVERVVISYLEELEQNLCQQIDSTKTP